MIVSWNWLAQYVKLDMPVEELSHRLMLAGLNHEGTEEIDGDFAIDLEVTSNRADCLSHLGVAREVGALFDRPLQEPAVEPKESGEPVDGLTSVRVDEPALCPYFTARVVSGVRIGESPTWMRQRLKTLGVRSISNIVDITNYVMFECGQPLHTYDLDLLRERRLVIRQAAEKETLTAINGKAYELRPGMLAIADAERPVGLAGVMGGLETEIGPKTVNVLIEAAVFDPVSVRATARALTLHSPSSFRFERGVDGARTEWASRRCAQLILELAGGTLHPGVISVGTAQRNRPPIVLRFDQIQRVLGIEIPRDRVLSILSELGLKQNEASSNRAVFLAPSWRPDLEREIDLIEEVARVHGYEQIPEDRNVPLVSATRGARERVEAEARAALCGMGFDEAYTPSLVSAELDVPLVPQPPATSLRVDHSTRRRENVLRRGVSASLLAARAFNEARGQYDVSLFEIASVYLPCDPKTGTGVLPQEPTHLALVAGRDFSAMKGVVETLVARLGIDAPITARPAEAPLLARGQAAELQLDGRFLGFMGVMGEPDRERLGLKQSCALAELNFDLLVGRARLVSTFRPIPSQPAVERDLSLVVDLGISWAELSETVRAAGGDWLEAVQYLDTFRGPGISENAHSVHLSLRFRHPERTLSGDEVDEVVRGVTAACQERLGASLRA